VIYPRAKFHAPSFSVSLVIVIKLGRKYGFRVTAMLLLYVLQKTWSTKAAYVLKTVCHTKFQDPTLSDSNFSPASEFRKAAKLMA
jgi:hypothetical protein